MNLQQWSLTEDFCGDSRLKKAGFLCFTVSGRKLFLFGATVVRL
jgi:hypothetical protein